MTTPDLDLTAVDLLDPKWFAEGPVERVPSSWSNSLTSLPITFTPGAREAA